IGRCEQVRKRCATHHGQAALETRASDTPSDPARCPDRKMVTRVTQLVSSPSSRPTTDGGQFSTKGCWPMNLRTIEIKAYVPARDLGVSTAFYQALGFEVPWSGEDLAYVRYGDNSFLLQRFYVPDHANNFMMHLLVENADDWHTHVVACKVVERFGVFLEEPADRSGGLRDFPLTDPTGVLWRIGHNIGNSGPG